MTRSKINVLVAALALVPMLLTACERRGPASSTTPFQAETDDYVLAVVLDMSGSFYHKMQSDDGVAYRYFMRLTDSFFRQRLGSNDRIVISQLSCSNDPLLWEGSPRSLRRQFPNATAFRDFLTAKADPKCSRVYTAIANTAEYLNRHPGIAGGQTRSAIFVLSDMLDNTSSDPNAPNPERDRAIAALTAFGRDNTVIGLYWVHQGLLQTWMDVLNTTGARDWVVEPDIKLDPRVPTFD